MGKRKEAIFNKAKELEKKIIVGDTEESLIEPKDRIESFKAKYEIRALISATIAKSIETLGFDKMIENAAAFGMTEDKISELIVSCAKKINTYKTKNEEINNLIESASSNKDKAKAIINKYNELGKTAEIRDYFINQMRTFESLKTASELETFVEKLSTMTGKDADEYLPDESVFENPLDNGLKKEECPIKDEIDALKAEYANDKEFLKVLDSAYNATLKGNSATVSFQSEVAERIGKDSLTFETADAVKSLKAHNIDLKDFDIRPKSIIFNGEVNDEKIAEYTRTAYATFPKISDDLRARLINIEKYINDNGYGDKLDDVDDFTPLANARDKVKEAVLSKNKEEIEKAVKEYANVNHFFKSLMQYCNALTPLDRFPNNMSKGRVASVPFEYRSDVKGTSYLRAVIAMIKDAKEAGITLEDYANNPAKANTKLIDDFTKKQDEKYSVKNLNIVEAINYLQTNNLAAYMSENGKFASIGHGFTVLSSAVNDETQAELRMKLLMLSRGYNDKRMISFTSFLGSTESLANMIAVEAEDRNPRDLYVNAIKYDDNLECKNFNMNEYFAQGKTSPSAVASRIADIYDGMSDKNDGKTKFVADIKTKVVDNACKKNAEVILDNRDIKISETAKKTLLNVQKGTPEKISKTDKLILEKEAAITKVVSNGLVKETPNKAVNTLADLKRDYARRNFLLKIFGSETRRLSRTINTLTESIVSSGITAEMLNEKMTQALRGELENEAVVNAVNNENNEIVAEKKPVILDLDDDEVALENGEANIANNKVLDLDEEPEVAPKNE